MCLCLIFELPSRQENHLKELARKEREVIQMARFPPKRDSNEMLLNIKNGIQESGINLENHVYEQLRNMGSNRVFLDSCIITIITD